MSFDPGFRAARRAGSHGVFRLVLPLVFLGFLVLLAGPVSSAGSFGTPTPFLVVAGIAALIVLWIFVKGARRWARNRGAWSRAARGAVSLTLNGEAVAAQREVSGRPMRTVVVEHRGHQHYLHLLFPKDAPADTMVPGRVTVEFFAGDAVEGPARLLLADGRTLWAFTSQLGTRALPKTRATRSSGTTSDTASGTSSDGSAALLVPATFEPGAPGDRGRGTDGRGDGVGDGPGDAVPSPAFSPDPSANATWSGGDGWTGGSSWGGDSTWTGSDGGGSGHAGGGGDGGGWFGGGDSGGWSGGDSGGGGGDSGGGS